MSSESALDLKNVDSSQFYCNLKQLIYMGGYLKSANNSSGPGQDPSDPTPTPSSPCTISIPFHSQILQVLQISAQQLSISFLDMATSTAYSCQAHLQRINTKTVLGALTRAQPNILTAILEPFEQTYVLIVEVNHELLPKIEERIVFDSKKLNQGEAFEQVLEQMQKEGLQLKKKMEEVIGCQIKYGQIGWGDVLMRMPHQRTIFTWSLKAENISGNIIKLQVLYRNSKTNEELNSQFIPNNKICVYAPNRKGSAQMRFVVEPIENFDQLVFRIESSLRGKYTLAFEKF